MNNKWTKLIARLSLSLALPLIVVMESKLAQAQLTFPAQELSQEIAEYTSIPILLPSYLPLKKSQVYYSGKANSQGYDISFAATPNCGGTTACHYGNITAERGGKLIGSPSVANSPRYDYQTVRLANGIDGVYERACGAHCTTLIEWQYQDIRYRVYVKNGSFEELVEIANSAITAGPR